jgi:hypothetical protein
MAPLCMVYSFSIYVTIFFATLSLLIDKVPCSNYTKQLSAKSYNAFASNGMRFGGEGVFFSQLVIIVACDGFTFRKTCLNSKLFFPVKNSSCAQTLLHKRNIYSLDKFRSTIYKKNTLRRS